MDYLATKNAIARLRWKVRWCERGGSQWPARDLPDLRTEHELRYWRTVQFRLYRARRDLIHKRAKRERLQRPLLVGRAAQHLNIAEVP